MQDTNSDGLQLELCDHMPMMPEAIQSYKPTYKPFPWHFFAEPEGRALHDAEAAKWLATQPEGATCSTSTRLVQCSRHLVVVHVSLTTAAV